MPGDLEPAVFDYSFQALFCKLQNGNVSSLSQFISICSLPYNTKLSRLHGKLLFRHKTFAVAHDGPKDYACEGDY